MCILHNIRIIRNSLGLSIQEVADGTGCHRETLARIELGKQDCTASLLRSIAVYLCCTADEVLQAEPLTASRLAEIKAAYYQREADRAREEARAAS